MSRASRKRREIRAAIIDTRRRRAAVAKAVEHNQQREHIEAVLNVVPLLDETPWDNPKKSDPAADIRAARHKDIEKMKGIGSTS